MLDGVDTLGNVAVGHVLLDGDSLDGHRARVHGDRLTVNRALGGGLGGAIGGVVDRRTLGTAGDAYRGSGVKGAGHGAERRLSHLDLILGGGNSAGLVALFDGDGLDGHILVHGDASLINSALGGGVGTIGGVVDGSTLGSGDGYLKGAIVDLRLVIEGRSVERGQVDRVGCGGNFAVGHALLDGDSLDGRRAIVNNDSLTVNRALGGGLGAIGGVVDSSTLGSTRDGHILYSSECLLLRFRLKRRPSHRLNHGLNLELVVLGVDCDSVLASGHDNLLIIYVCWVKVKITVNVGCLISQYPSIIAHGNEAIIVDFTPFIPITAFAFGK